MNRPHEEEWTMGEGALSGDTWIGSFTNAERARLAGHAPELARRLMANGAVGTDGEWHNDACLEYGHGKGCEADRAALKAAGVIP